MNTYHRRYIFVDFDNLRKVKLKKLGKVCDRVYVFISSGAENIPFQLVLTMQKLGKGVKWVLVDDPQKGSMDLLMSFVIGRLHQKVDKSVEFAVLSNDPAFESLVHFVNKSGRSCVRVKQEKSEEEPGIEKKIFESFKEPDFENFAIKSSNGGSAKSGPILPEPEDMIGRTAEETIKRLIRSGNRPSNIHLLREYILLNNQELILESNVEKVIKKLENAHEIQLKAEDVVYNF